jgi:DNA segregation ATPase FtsK/SpoIIIE, S-DNA-T family
MTPAAVAQDQMPKPASSNSNTGPSFQGVRHRPNWPAAVILLVLGVLLTVALLDYDPSQSRAINVPTPPTERNLVGWFGAETSYWSLHWIGVSAWLVPVFLLWFGFVALRNARRLVLTRFVAMLLSVGAFSGLWAMWEGFRSSQYFPFGTGGLLGRLIYVDAFKDVLGVFGSALLFAVLYVLGLMFIFTKDITTEIERIVSSLQAWWQRRALIRAEHAALKREFEQAQVKSKADAKKAATASAKMPALSPAEPKERGSGGPPDGTGELPPRSGPEDLPADAIVPPDAAQPKPSPVVLAARETARAAAAAVSGESPAAAGKLELTIVKPEEPKKAKVTLPPPGDTDYQFPPLSLLREQSPVAPENSEEEHRRNAENLLRILMEFGVQVSLGEIHVGPVITRYEIVPAPGVRVEKIAGLDKNIALGMRAQSVRILAPIPGKAAVGVEVPNQHPTPVGIREILESEDWGAALSKGELPIALGKDVSGKPIVSDLTKMPHLLIAGTTGSGKSVCINSIIASILYSKSPKDLRLIMVDPKIVELKVFNTLPHMLIPVVTEPKKVPAALKWLLSEMEQRYQIFAKVGVRNIVGFNHRRRTPGETPPPPEQPGLAGLDPSQDDGIEVPDRLPYIVAIIDELADLMMVAPAEVETSIARLAQLARAAGIHLIIATQRPSVNVITGVIKANLPSRIAFQVASQVDSRTILDVKGADTLIGRGDMLFSPPGTSRLVRAQGAFVSDEEIHGVVDFMKRNGPPAFATDVQAHIDRAAREDDEELDDDADMGDDEELYRQAIDVLKSTRRASTSMIQRRLRIGYNRAARIMDLMEQKGIVGPENGSSPREILVDPDSL